MPFDYPREALFRASLLYCSSFLTTRHVHALVRALGSAEEAWQAPVSELTRAGLTSYMAERFIEARKDISQDAIARKLAEHAIGILTSEDPLFPPLLKHIYDTPPALFYRGTLTPRTFARAIAVVGTRKITPYGRYAITQMVPPLARAGVTVVSGMAIGSDGYAHTAALDAGGNTVAFLGSGLDDESLYPRTHCSLAYRIINNGGALFSEFPPGTLPLRHHFPVRNRLIAGASTGVLVTEAAEDSGSLITARLALEYGREVFAVPGAIHAPLSLGPNTLIQMGAHVALSAEDLLNILELSSVHELPFPEPTGHHELSADEQKIISALSVQPLIIDELIAQSKLESKTAITLITLLELNGYIKHMGNQMYAAI